MNNDYPYIDIIGFDSQDNETEELINMYINARYHNDFPNFVETNLQDSCISTINQDTSDPASNITDIEIKSLESSIDKKNGKPVFSCQHCKKIYKSKENLTLHIRNIHFKEKPYNCKYCSAVFSHRNGKTYHERKFHTNYLPYECEFCHTFYASKSAMTYHAKTKHSSKAMSKFKHVNKLDGEDM